MSLYQLRKLYIYHGFWVRPKWNFVIIFSTIFIFIMYINNFLFLFFVFLNIFIRFILHISKLKTLQFVRQFCFVFSVYCYSFGVVVFSFRFSASSSRRKLSGVQTLNLLKANQVDCILSQRSCTKMSIFYTKTFQKRYLTWEQWEFNTERKAMKLQNEFNINIHTYMNIIYVVS